MNPEVVCLDEGLGLEIIIQAMSWYYSKNGTQLGPISEEEMSAKVKVGEIAPTDLIWQEGMADWKPAGQVSAIQGNFSVSQSSTPQAQMPAKNYGQHPPVRNYLWQSIVVTILCCLPLGIVGIVFATRVDTMLANGDIAGAQTASKSAKTWTIASLVVGLVFKHPDFRNCRILCDGVSIGEIANV